MNAEVYNGYWISTDTYLTQEHRNVNARNVYQYLRGLGWTLNAIAGMLGNFDVESSINPALIENRNYHTLITNAECLVIPDTLGVGMAQWTGNTPTAPAGQKLASFAIRHNMNWYDGDLQCLRWEREYDDDLQFDHLTVDGVQWDWNSYVISTETPEQLAKVWQRCYERGGSDTATRQAKARMYYNMLKTKPWLWYLFLIRKDVKGPCRTI